MRAARIILLAVLCSVGLAGTAQAAFPGQNGKIALTSSGRIQTFNPDGTGGAALTTMSDHSAAWSADGQRVAFVSLRDGAPTIATRGLTSRDATSAVPRKRNSTPPSSANVRSCTLLGSTRIVIPFMSAGV